MDNKITSLQLAGVEIPVKGWVLWQGDLPTTESLYRQILRLEPADKLVVNKQDVNFQKLSVGVKMAAIFEWGGLLSNRSLLDNLLLPFDYHSKDTVLLKQKIIKIFTSLNYERYLEERPYFVPRNVQKLTMILRAFLQEPECIFAINLSFGLEENDKSFLLTFMQDYRHINVHFSEGIIHDRDEFTEVVNTTLWEKDK
jgi:ABC-type lipoprotein export system ATPase subunit